MKKEEMSTKKEKPMYVKFISGKVGYGKEEYAVEWCRKQNLAYYRMSNDLDNPFSSYCGEPVIIWSDARDDKFEPHELYQLIDDHYNSMCSDRYISAECLFITTIIPLEQWYEKEDKAQLYRHIPEKVVMDENNISFYLYNKDTNTYDYVCKLPNDYIHEEAVRDTKDKPLVSNTQPKGSLRMKNEELKIRISTKKKEKLREISNARGESMSYVIERLIDSYIEKYSKNKK